MYRRAASLVDVIVGFAQESGPGFKPLWGVAMRKKGVKDAFAEAGLKPYHGDADVRETQLLDRVRDVIQWGKANHRVTHPRQVYETLCTAVADPSGETMGWTRKRLGIGVTAMQSGTRRRKVLDESYFEEGLVFNDDRADFKTKNDLFPAEALLQQLFWVEGVSRTSPNTGDNVYQCLRGRKEEALYYYGFCYELFARAPD